MCTSECFQAEMHQGSEFNNSATGLFLSRTPVMSISTFQLLAPITCLSREFSAGRTKNLLHKLLWRGLLSLNLFSEVSVLTVLHDTSEKAIDFLPFTNTGHGTRQRKPGMRCRRGAATSADFQTLNQRLSSNASLTTPGQWRYLGAGWRLNNRKVFLRKRQKRRNRNLKGND